VSVATTASEITSTDGFEATLTRVNQRPVARHPRSSSALRARIAASNCASQPLNLTARIDSTASLTTCV
jgi:hypothetical protein